MHSLTMVKTLLLVVFFVATITEGKKIGKAVGGVLTAAGSVGLPLAGILGGTGTTSSPSQHPYRPDPYRPDPYRADPHRQGYARSNAGMGVFMEPVMALVV